MPGLSNAIGDLFVKVRPDTTGFGAEAAAGVKAQSGVIGKSGGIGKAGKVIGLGLAAGAAGAFAKGIGDFVDFERGLNEVFTLIPDAPDSFLDELTQQVKDFSAETGNLPQDVIKPLYDSISAGIPKSDAISFLEDANKFAKAGATDLATAVDALTTGVNAYGLGAEDAGRISDALFTGVKLGKTTVDELAASLFQVAPVANLVGVPIEDISASLATLTAQGTPTKVAATQMKSALSELAKEGTKADQAFRSVNEGKGIVEFLENGGTFKEVVQSMNRAAGEADKSLIDMFGSIEAGQAFVGLGGSDTAYDSFTDNLRGLDDAAGSTQEAFEKMEEGIGPVLDKIKARLAVAFLGLGETLAPTIETIGTAVADFVLILSKLPGPVLAGIVGFIGLAGALLVLAGPILRMIQVVKLLSGAFTLLAANPIVLAILAIAAAAFIIYKNWEPIKKFVEDLWEDITEAFETAKGVVEDIMGSIADFFTEAWDTIKGIFNGVKDFLAEWWRLLIIIFLGPLGIIINLIIVHWDTIKMVIGAAIEFITAFLTEAWEIIKTIISVALEVIQTIVQTVWGVIQTVIETAMTIINGVIQVGLAIWESTIVPILNGIRAVFETVWGIITAVVETAVGLITGFLNILLAPIGGITGAIESLRDLWDTVWNGMSNVINGVVDNIVGAINRVKDAASDALGPVGDVLGFAGGAIGTLIGKAGGGPVVAGQPYVVGENGKELFIPGENGKIVPNGAMRSMMTPGTSGGGGGMVVQGPLLVIKNANVRSDQDITNLSRRLADDARRVYRAEGRQVTP